MYQIGVISDTHGLLRSSALDILSSCNAILHCGDINNPSHISQLKDIAPLYAVRGNTDKEWAANLPKTLSIELYGVRLFLIHNRKQIKKETITSHHIILYGHSHKYECFEKNGQTWLNPGSCGARRFSLPVTMAVVAVGQHAGFQISRINLAAEEKPADSQMLTPAEMKKIVLCVMKETDKGKPVCTIAKSCRIDAELAERICRLYLTHPGVSADGILAKMGL